MRYSGFSFVSRALLLVSLSAVLSGCQVTQHQLPLELMYSSKDAAGRSIYTMNSGQESGALFVAYTGSDGYPAVSPDGKKVAFYGKYDNNKTWSIHVVDRDSKKVTRLTHDKNIRDSSPAWSADGKKIVFAREFKNSRGKWQEQIWMIKADGSDAEQVGKLTGGGPVFMKDGRILFHSKTGTSEICIANADGSNLITLTNNDAEDWYPDINADGSKIAFMSNRDGGLEIYTMDIDGSNQKRLTFNQVADWNPSWSADGQRLIFSSETPSFFDVYMMSNDGSDVRKIISNASQASFVK